MVNRVLIAGGVNAVMSVSLPGFDVLTANCDQMCFDSRWAGLIPFMTGVADTSGGSLTVNFGVTLDVPPMFVGAYVQIISGVEQTTYGNTPTLYRGGGTDQWFYVNTTVSNMNFVVHGWGTTIWRLHYTLFKRPSG